MNDPLGLAKVWKKINIWEVSACGIPMYPKAHKSFSLVKALQETEDLVSDELNVEEKPMEDSEEKTEDSESESEETSEATEEKSEEAKEETPAEAPAEEAKPEEKPEGEAEKSAKILQDAIVKGFKTAIKEAQTDRGLVAPAKSIQEQMSEELKKKSIGELAVMSGLFQKPPIVGSSLEMK